MLFAEEVYGETTSAYVYTSTQGPCIQNLLVTTEYLQLIKLALVKVLNEKETEDRHSVAETDMCVISLFKLIISSRKRFITNRRVRGALCLLLAAAF